MKTPQQSASGKRQSDVIQDHRLVESAVTDDKDEKKKTSPQCSGSIDLDEIDQFLKDKKAGLKTQTDATRISQYVYVTAMRDRSDMCSSLIKIGACVSFKDKENRTALQVACSKGHIKVAEVLLDHWCDQMKTLSEQNKDKYEEDWNGFLSHKGLDFKNCLDLAIENNHRDIAKMIIEKEGAFQFVMKNCVMVHAKKPNTPMRKLINCMPDVAEIAFTKCITREADKDTASEADKDTTTKADKETSTKADKSTRKKEKITFDFTFLDDAYTRRKWTGNSNQKEDMGTKTGHTNCTSIRHNTYKSYKKTHVLSLLSKTENMELLSHPLISGLLRQKTRRCLVFVWLYMGVYIPFIAYLSQTLIEVKPPYEYENIDSLVGKGSICEEQQTTTSPYVTIAFASFLLILELVQLCIKRRRYFNFDNLMEVCLFVFAIIFSIDVTPCSDATHFRYQWQWSLGICSTFFGWINLAFYLQKLTPIGIYLLMLKDVIGTFLEVCLVYILFIIAFALAFNAEIRNIETHETFWLSMVKAVVMMIGEFDFDDGLVGRIPYNSVSVYILFTSFMVIMTILLMNLLTALVVYDIKEIQGKAKLKRLQLQIDLVLDFDSVLQALPYYNNSPKMTLSLELRKLRRLPLNLHNHLGLPSYGLTIEEIDRVKNPKMTKEDRIQQQIETLKEMLVEQASNLKSLDGKLKNLIETQTV